MFQPVIVLSSSDDYLLKRELDQLEKDFTDPESKSFNYNQYSGGVDSPETIIETCLQSPMMGQSRMVVVQNVDDFKKDELENLREYFSNPSPTTILVLLIKRLDKRMKIWNEAASHGWVKELKLPYENNLSDWLLKEARNRNLTIETEAAQALSEAIGLNLMALITALQKIELFIAPRQDIQLPDIENVIGDFFSKNIFDLTNKVAKKDFKGATILLRHLVSRGEPPIRVVFMIGRHFKKLLETQDLLRQKISEREIAKNIGIHEFFIKNYIQQAKKVTPEELRRLYRLALGTDKNLKKSPLSSKHILDQFLMNVCFEP